MVPIAGTRSYILPMPPEGGWTITRHAGPQWRIYVAGTYHPVSVTAGAHGRNTEEDIPLSEANLRRERRLVLNVDPRLVKYPFLRSARDFLISYPLDEIVKSV